MRTRITISLPKERKDDVDRYAREEGVSRRDVLRTSIQDYLWIRKFRRLHAIGVKRARVMGIFTDEDVFDQVS